MVLHTIHLYRVDPTIFCPWFLCARTWEPGGASGWLLKSWFPLTMACADSLGFNLELLSRFKVRSACAISRSHSLIGNACGRDANPARKWFLNVRIARSAAFLRCWAGGTTWYAILYFFSAALSSFDISLSRMYINGFIPLCINSSVCKRKAFFRSAARRDCTGIAFI